jgi:hypothetical protein
VPGQAGEGEEAIMTVTSWVLLGVLVLVVGAGLYYGIPIVKVLLNFGPK